jgi:ribose transport system substrate-binding protein
VSPPSGWSKKLDGKGDIVMITGVPGTSVDDLRTKAAKEVFAKHPDIKIVGEAVGMWSQAVARTELSKITATRNWDQINGLWMQVGCYTANSMQLEAGKTPEQLLPCAGEGSNGGRIQMLPVGTEVEGAASPYAPLGAPRISYASPPYSGALALKLAVDAIEGKDVPMRVTLPLPLVTNETVKLCNEGTWEEMKAGCNAFLPSLVSNPGWFGSIFSEQTPGDRPRRRACRPA